jgi:ketosteroid isomerase-like protein
MQGAHGYGPFPSGRSGGFDMSIELPTPIAAYVAGSNAHDPDACAACFTDDAGVRDEGRERRGIAAIREWMAEVSEKYRPTVEVIGVAETDDKAIVTGRVSGNFPGSPVELRYTFTLVGEKIARLEIHP